MVYKNNPFNIRYNPANDWIGQIQPKNGFCQFNNLYNGYRAFARLMSNYRRLGLCTIRAFIERYAPKSENNTEAYIDYVSTKLFHNAYHDRDYLSVQNFFELGCWIHEYESGKPIIVSLWRDVFNDWFNDKYMPF